MRRSSRLLAAAAGMSVASPRKAATAAASSAAVAPPSEVRAALEQRLLDPARPVPYRRLYLRLCNPSHVVSEFYHPKTSRRLARLRTTLRFLRRHNVLLHSLLFYSPEGWRTTMEFDRLVAFGESCLAEEVAFRLHGMLPSLSHATFTALTASLLCESNLARLFDTLEMHLLTGSRPPRDAPAGPHHRKTLRQSLSTRHKRAMLCAAYAEMRWFVDKTKATDRTHNVAIFPPSDVLILHVMSQHLVECLPAELVFAALEPQLPPILAAWRNPSLSVPEQLRARPHTVSSLSLRLHPTAAPPAVSASPPPPPPAEVMRLAAEQLRPAPSRGLLSRMRPRCSHQRILDEPPSRLAEGYPRAAAELRLQPSPCARPAIS